EGGARKEPAQDYHVSRHRLEEQPAGMLRIEVGQMRDDGDVESRLHNKGSDQCLLEGPLRWVLALGLRQDDRQTMSAHGLQAFPLHVPLQHLLRLLPVRVKKRIVFSHRYQEATVAFHLEKPAGAVAVYVDPRCILEQFLI